MKREFICTGNYFFSIKWVQSHFQTYFHCNTLIHSKFHSELSHTIQNTWCAPRDHTQQDNQHLCVMNGLIRLILDQTLEQILCTFNWAYFPFMMNYQKVHSPLPTFIHCPFKLKIEARVYNKFMIIMFKFIKS